MLNANPMLDHLNQVLRELAKIEDQLEEDANCLVAAFWKHKLKLEEEEKQRQQSNLARVKQRVKHHGGTYAPLFLLSRRRTGGLELCWRLAQISRHGKAFYHHVPKGTLRAATGYNLCRLLPHARTWERDLVRNIEGRAEEIRRHWTQVQKLKRTVSSFLQQVTKADHRPAPADTRVDESPPDPRIMPPPPGWQELFPLGTPHDPT